MKQEIEIVNLRDLFVKLLGELYDSEKQQQQAFGKIVNRIQSETLKKIIGKTLEESTLHVQRIEKSFLFMNEKLLPKVENEIIGELIDNAERLIKQSSDEEVLEAGLIGSLQFINHYEIAGYGTASAYARALDYVNVSTLLHQCSMEEKEIDKELTRLAEESINRKARIPLIQ